MNDTNYVWNRVCENWHPKNPSVTVTMHLSNQHNESYQQSWWCHVNRLKEVTVVELAGKNIVKSCHRCHIGIFRRHNNTLVSSFDSGIMNNYGASQKKISSQ